MGAIMEYTIGEMSDILGLKPSTIRYYEKEGLISTVNRSQGGVRKFTQRDLEVFRIIECLKKTGMPLKDIKSFIDMTTQGDSTIGTRLELFKKQRDALNEQIKELQQALNVIEYKCWYYQTAYEAGSTSAPDSVPDEELPYDFAQARKMLKSKGK